MQIKINIPVVVWVLFLLTFISCAEERLKEFQINDATSYSIPAFVTSHPAIYEMLNSVDQIEFNDKLLEAIGNDAPEDAIRVMNLSKEMLSNPEHPVTDSIDISYNLLDRVVNQDKFDNDPYNNYTKDFYNFSDRMIASGADVQDDIITIAKKLVRLADYYNQKDPDMLMQDLEYLADFLKDKDLAEVDAIAGETAGKLLLENDDAANGVDQILYAVSRFVKDEKINSKIESLILEAGTLTAAENSNKRLSRILRELMINLRDYYTEDGVMTSSYKDTRFAFGGVYDDYEVVESLGGMLPLIRTSMAPDASDSSYFLDNLARSLYRLNINWQEIDPDKALNVLTTCDAGMNPLQPINLSDKKYHDDGVNLEDQVSFLDRYLFTAVCAAKYGWNDNNGWDANDNTHASMSGGVIHLNDSLVGNNGLNMNLKDLLPFMPDYKVNAHLFTMNSPELASSRVFRSKSDFNGSTSSGKEFFINSDYPSIALATGRSVGDIGLPYELAEARPQKANRGNDPPTFADLNMFRGEDAKGLKADNSATYGAGWIARVCWEGEGPYFSEEGSKTENGKKVYYAADGKTVYATEDSNGFHDSTFKSEWETDNYLIQLHSSTSGESSYYSLDAFAANGEGNFLLESNVNQPLTPAGKKVIHEIIKNKDGNNATLADRKCKTQLDAMYKNYQWVLYYKKMVFIAPLLVNFDLNDNNVELLGLYGVVEANGLKGIANVRKTSGNSNWAYAPGTGYFNNSNYPGDYRLTILEGHNFKMTDFLDFAKNVFSDISITTEQLTQIVNLVKPYIGLLTITDEQINTVINRLGTFTITGDMIQKIIDNVETVFGELVINNDIMHMAINVYESVFGPISITSDKVDELLTMYESVFGEFELTSEDIHYLISFMDGVSISRDQVSQIIDVINNIYNIGLPADFLSLLFPSNTTFDAETMNNLLYTLENGISIDELTIIPGIGPISIDGEQLRVMANLFLANGASITGNDIHDIIDIVGDMELSGTQLRLLASVIGDITLTPEQMQKLVAIARPMIENIDLSDAQIAALINSIGDITITDAQMDNIISFLQLNFSDETFLNDTINFVVNDVMKTSMASMFYDMGIGSGTLAPVWIVKNLITIERLAYFNSQNKGEYISPENTITPEKADLYPQERDGLFPIIVAALGNMHEKATVDNNMIDLMANDLLPYLAGPMFYKGENPEHSEYDCWIPRFAGSNIFESDSNLPDGEKDLYFHQLPLRSSMSIMIGSSMNGTDGLLPLVSNTHLVSSLFDVISAIGDPAYSTERIDLCSGLYSTMKTMKGNDVGPHDIDVTELMNSIVYKGVVPLIEKHESGEYDWNRFENLVNLSSELISNNGETKGKYNIVPELTSTSKKLLSSVEMSNDDIKALRHTAGVLFAKYDDGKWQYPSDISNLLRNELPPIVDLSMPYLDDAVTKGSIFLKDDGFIDFLFNSVHSSYDTETVVNEFHDLLALESLRDPNSLFWNDMTSLIDETIVLLSADDVNNTAGWIDSEFRMGMRRNGKYSNYDYQNATLLNDPYTALRSVIIGE